MITMVLISPYSTVFKPSERKNVIGGQSDNMSTIAHMKKCASNKVL